MNKNKGFTLIELLVVIAIIGVVAAIVLGMLGSSKSKGNDAKIVSQLKSMVNQAQLYTGPTASIPNSTAAIVGVSGGNLFTNSDLASNSLYRLASSLPSGTFIYYSAENKSPLAGGRWAIAAATSTGSYCVDYTGIGRAVIGPPLDMGNVSGRYIQLQSSPTYQPAYSCRPDHD